MRARLYNSELGRFMSPDPEGFAGKSPNLYTYAGNHGTRSIDPTGEIVLPVIAAGAVIGGTFAQDCSCISKKDTALS